jgi:hypothetical protein
MWDDRYVSSIRYPCFIILYGNYLYIIRTCMSLDPIVDPLLRKPLAEIFERFGLDIVVLSHAEIDPNAKFEVLGSVEIEI